MPKPTPKFTVAEMHEALEKAEGLHYLAARSLKCHAQTVDKYVARHPSLQEITRQKKGERVDLAEGMLWQKVQAGEAWAVIFFLKTQGRDRGYTERYDFSHQFKGMTDEQLLAFITDSTRARGGDGDGSAAAGGADPDDGPTVH